MMAACKYCRYVIFLAFEADLIVAGNCIGKMAEAQAMLTVCSMLRRLVLLLG